jgi:L-ascorbate metabolism protein UlaG (beta-lactamase superfamily)
VLGVLLGLLFATYVGAWALAYRAKGKSPEGARQQRIIASPQWSGKRFTNVVPRVDGPALEMLRAWIFDGSPHARASAPIDVVSRRRDDFEKPPASGLRATWLGHSTVVLEIDGHRVLVDPVWGPRASPFSFVGPGRWYPSPLPLAELPPIDVVVISHDHYDHLDMPTVLALADRDMRWAVPLGVGAHLESWGVAPERIVELDWWEQVSVGALTLTATPARHFSGRWIDDADRTLWAGWAIAGPSHRVFYSGDTALFDGLTEIGQRLGPFDLTLIEVGAYDKLWADVHLGPEQAVLAHRMVKGELLLPVHWGLFDLALHGWTEPMERVVVAAREQGVRVATPRPGEQVEPRRHEAPPADIPQPVASAQWWPALPWRTAQQAPVRSTNVTVRD